MVNKVNKLRIRTYPDPVLKKKAKEIKIVDGDIKKLADDMIETMYAGEGVGLAGPQVGISKRIFGLDTGDGPRVFINPQIFKKRGRQVEVEGCLSLPGVEAKVKRSKSLRCKYLDKEGRSQEIAAEGLLARVIQHENDHLDGVLFVDRLWPWQRKRLLRDSNTVVTHCNLLSSYGGSPAG